MLNKVPEVTLYFWVIKILCTTVGETFADYLNDTLGFGLDNTAILMTAALAVALVFQFRARRYIPGVYWLAVVLISVVGTLLSDKLVDDLGVPLQTSTIAFAVLLAITFAAWYASERTLSIHSIVTTRRETFYWLAILFTFALGTSAGDLFDEQMGVGYWPTVAPRRGRHRADHRRALLPQAQRGARVLAGLHPDPPAGRVDRRRHVAGARRTAVSASARRARA